MDQVAGWSGSLVYTLVKTKLNLEVLRTSVVVDVTKTAPPHSFHEWQEVQVTIDHLRSPLDLKADFRDDGTVESVEQDSQLVTKGEKIGPGDRIIAVGRNKSIGTSGELESAIGELDGTEPVTVTFRKVQLLVAMPWVVVP